MEMGRLPDLLAAGLASVKKKDFEFAHHHGNGYFPIYPIASCAPGSGM
jgi:hypothetical protein